MSKGWILKTPTIHRSLRVSFAVLIGELEWITEGDQVRSRNLFTISILPEGLIATNFAPSTIR